MSRPLWLNTKKKLTKILLLYSLDFHCNKQNCHIITDRQKTNVTSFEIVIQIIWADINKLRKYLFHYLSIPALKTGNPFHLGTYFSLYLLASSYIFFSQISLTLWLFYPLRVLAFLSCAGKWNFIVIKAIVNIQRLN